MKIPVGVSKRHVHLKKEVFKELFGEDEIIVRNYLNQPGEFASTVTVDIKWNNKILERVRVIGPFRKYNQIELSKSDADILEINPPVRKSGDVEGSLPIIICGPNKEVELEIGVVLAQRHIHMDNVLAQKLNLKDEESVLIYKNGMELFDANIKISEPSFLELHIDTDEANLYSLNQNDEVEVYKCGK